MRGFVLRAMRVLPRGLQRRLRTVPVVSWAVRAVLNRALPPGSYRFHRVLAGALRDMVLECDARCQAPMLVGKYEPQVHRALEGLVRPGDVVFDVGAHIGYWTLVFAETVGPKGQVVGFEPDPDNFGRLSRNVERNRARIGDATVVWAGVASRTGQAGFVRGLGSGAGGLSPTGGDIQVPIESLDHAAARFGPPAFVKMDVEGGELDVLHGARDLLARGRTRFLIEMHSEHLRRECTRLLEDAGYRIRVVEGAEPPVVHAVAMPPR